MNDIVHMIYLEEMFLYCCSSRILLRFFRIEKFREQKPKKKRFFFSKNFEKKKSKKKSSSKDTNTR